MAALLNTGNLKIHLKTHSGEKSIVCNQCDCQFYAFSEDTQCSGEKSSKCSQCDFASSYANALRDEDNDSDDKDGKADNDAGDDKEEEDRLDGRTPGGVPLFHFEENVAQDASDLVVQRFRDLIHDDYADDIDHHSMMMTVIILMMTSGTGRVL